MVKFKFLAPFPVDQLAYPAVSRLILLVDHVYYYHHYCLLMVFHWSLSDRKSPQVFRTLLGILALLNIVVVSMVSTRPPTSKSSSPFSYPLVTVPNAPITIGIIVTFMFHSFFQFPRKIEVLILLSTFFQFYSVVNWDSKVDSFANSLFLLLIIIRSGLLAEIR